METLLVLTLFIARLLIPIAVLLATGTLLTRVAARRM